MNTSSTIKEPEFRFPIKIKPDPFIVEERIGWEDGKYVERIGWQQTRRTRESAFEFAYAIIEQKWQPLGLTFRVLDPQTQEGDYAYFAADEGENICVRFIFIRTYSQAGFKLPRHY